MKYKLTDTKHSFLGDNVTINSVRTNFIIKSTGTKFDISKYKKQMVF